jgi:cytochrome o ubiquinol oxidase subunit 1
MVIGGVLFGFFAGVNYWFPKVMGFTLNDKLGKIAAYLWIIGFIIAFMPLYVLGMMGATRRLDHYDASTGWHPIFIFAGIGALIIFSGMCVQFLQLIVSIKDRKKNRDLTGDPWNGRTLEWSIPSPAPLYNFAVLPEVHEKDAFWETKEHPPKGKPRYEEIHLPKNSPLGLFIGILSFLCGFSLIWHIFWLALLSILGVVTCLIVRFCDDHPEFSLSPKEVEEMEKQAMHKGGVI